MIESFLTSKFLTEVYNYLKGKTFEKKVKLIISQSDLENAINLHIKFVNNWASDVQFRDMENPKALERIYIDLDFYVTPLRLQYFENKRENSLKLEEVFKKQNRHLVILGQPGAGKTTSMKHLCQRLIFDENFYPGKFKFPVVIRLRDLGLDDYSAIKTKRISLISKLQDILGLHISFGKSTKEEQRNKISRRIVVDFVDQLQIMLILDGFDEIEEQKDKVAILKDIRDLSLHLIKSRLILTSRSGDFFYEIENSAVYEICPLNEGQIHEFCSKWLQSETRAVTLQKQIKKSPFADTTIRPLTLAHLCAIYSKYDKIPEKPKTVYRKIVNLFLEEWDLQRSIKRTSKYGNFEIDRKFEFLTNLSFFLTTVHQKTVFTFDELKDTYGHIAVNFDLPINEVNKVINELEAHNGLFQQTSQYSFEFAHKSIQEYLSAEYLVKLPSIPESKKLLLSIPNELALAVSISSSPTIYFAFIVLKFLEEDIIKEGFLESFLSRIIIEKPDFSPHPILGVSILNINSLLIFKVQKTRQKRKKAFDLLEEIFANPTVNYSIDGLKRYYEDNHLNKENQYIELNKVETISNLPELYQPTNMLIEKKYWQ